MTAHQQTLLDELKAIDAALLVYWLSVKMRNESKRGEIPPCGRGFSRHKDLSIRCI